MINPGEIFYATVDGAGTRPVIVVSQEPFNRGRFVCVVPCTSKKFLQRRNFPNCVPFNAGQFGFHLDSVAQCELVAAVEINNLDLSSGPIGTLDDVALRSVIKAIGHVLDSDCEPN
jgi:mRNA-degrading endonuclease toxin of MazEF toxin-antitoxin module